MQMCHYAYNKHTNGRLFVIQLSRMILLFTNIEGKIIPIGNRNMLTKMQLSLLFYNHCRSNMASQGNTGQTYCCCNPRVKIARNDSDIHSSTLWYILESKHKALTLLLCPKRQSSSSHNLSALRKILFSNPKWDYVDDIHMGALYSKLDTKYALK